jgi:hypothetical protein
LDITRQAAQSVVVVVTKASVAVATFVLSHPFLIVGTGAVAYVVYRVFSSDEEAVILYPPPCFQCHASGIDLLSRPRSKEQYFSRKLHVQSSCGRCSHGYFFTYTCIEVFLPGEFVCNGQIGLYTASDQEAVKTKLLNWRMKITSACTVQSEIDYHMQHALLAIGRHACIDDAVACTLFSSLFRRLTSGDRASTWKAVPVEKPAAVATAASSPSSPAPVEPLPATSEPEAVEPVAPSEPEEPAVSAESDTTTETDPPSSTPDAQTVQVTEFVDEDYDDFAFAEGLAGLSKRINELTDDTLRLEYQQGAHVNKFPMLSKHALFADLQGSKANAKLFLPTEVLNLSQLTDIQQGVARAVLDEPIGERTARTRFPQATASTSFLHSNHPSNLVDAEARRNVGVGDCTVFNADVEKHLRKAVFTVKRLQAAAKSYDTLFDILPQKYSVATKEAIITQAIVDEPFRGPKRFSSRVGAFVKSEVSAKEIARAIANHGPGRLTGIARAAYIFEYCLFDVLHGMTIKHRDKKAAISEMLRGMNAKPGIWIENDMSSFEFGISHDLKAAEVSTLKHIIGVVGADGLKKTFEGLMSDRTKCATWTFQFTDALGQFCMLALALPRPMRESGDRITSSGNFYQNLLAWLEFLVDPQHMAAAIESLVENGGTWFIYVSKRDGKKYWAYLAFEGDDTLGKLTEWNRKQAEAFQELSESFFKARGWRAKLRVPTANKDFIRFVSYDAMLSCGRIIVENDVIVMCPEIKRNLKTKSWSTTDAPPAAFAGCVMIYAKVMASEFANLPPMYAFYESLYNDHKVNAVVSTHLVASCREMMIKRLGYVPTAEEAEVVMREWIDGEFPSRTDNASLWYSRLARVSAGEYTTSEWTTMCSLTSLNMHGADLQRLLPASWLS